MARIAKTKNNQCDFCHGTGKKPPLRITEKSAKAFFGNIVLVDRLEQYTDKEVAEIACTELWAIHPLGSREGEILSTMIDRLKRAGQGEIKSWSDPEYTCDLDD